MADPQVSIAPLRPERAATENGNLRNFFLGRGGGQSVLTDLNMRPRRPPSEAAVSIVKAAWELSAGRRLPSREFIEISWPLTFACPTDVSLQKPRSLFQEWAGRPAKFGAGAGERALFQKRRFIGPKQRLGREFQ